MDTTPHFPIYMDYGATTPVDQRVVDAMIPWLREHFGNAASRSHAWGWEAEEAIEQARGHVADLIGADPREIVWTSGATESINLALNGAAQFYQDTGKHLITLKTEHKAVLDTMRELERRGFDVTYMDVQEDGLLSLEALQVEQSIGLHVEVGHLEALPFELAHRVQHGLVLGLDGDQVLALGLVEMRRTLDAEVVRFGGARGPDDLSRIGADQLGHLDAGTFDGLFGLPAPGVAA